MKEIITRYEAQLRGLTRYFTGKLCSNGHVSERYTINGVCAKCNLNSVNAFNRRKREVIR